MTDPTLPMRLFREGSEPNGERVQSYSELGYIDEIANSLTPGDMEILKKSQFGKVFDLPEGAAYSGKLIHFLLTRQLVVSKKMKSGSFLEGRLFASQSQSLKDSLV